jgi:ribonuclease P protein component
MKPEGFGRWLRLRRRADFLRVQRTGEKHHMRNFLVFIAASEPNAELDPESTGALEVSAMSGNEAARTLLPVRLGITVTRKVGGAVVRTRLKRLVREAYRRNQVRLQPGLDMVWVAKRGAANVTYRDVLEDMEALIGRLAQRSISRPQPHRAGAERRPSAAQRAKP